MYVCIHILQALCMNHCLLYACVQALCMKSVVAKQLTSVGSCQWLGLNLPAWVLPSNKGSRAPMPQSQPTPVAVQAAWCQIVVSRHNGVLAPDIRTEIHTYAHVCMHICTASMLPIEAKGSPTGCPSLTPSHTGRKLCYMAAWLRSKSYAPCSLMQSI